MADHFIMKFDFKDGIVFPVEVELIKECFKGNECFDPKEFTIVGNEVVIKGDFDWDKYLENLSEDEKENVRWFDVLAYNIHQIFDYSGRITGDVKGYSLDAKGHCLSPEEEAAHRFRFCDLKIKFHYWLTNLDKFVPRE